MTSDVSVLIGRFDWLLVANGSENYKLIVKIAINIELVKKNICLFGLHILSIFG